MGTIVHVSQHPSSAQSVVTSSPTRTSSLVPDLSRPDQHSSDCDVRRLFTRRIGFLILFSHGFRHLLLRRRHLMLLIHWRVHNFVARTRLVEYLARSLVLAPLVISTSLSLKAMDIKMTGGVPTLLLLFLCRVRAGHGRVTLNNSRRRRSTT